MSTKPPQLLVVLPGLHRVRRGAEAAFEAVADGLARDHGFDVTVVGGGEAVAGTAYRFIHSPLVVRERFEKWPRFPPFRNEFRWEELTFALGLGSALRGLRPDVSMTCSYPFVNWALRRLKTAEGRKVPHVFVTQNGDHPALRLNSEYKAFSCDGLVCTNPLFYERQRDRWFSALIPNGIDPGRFSPGAPQRAELGLPEDGPLVIMASALIPSKRVAEGLRAAAALPGASFAIAGDGPLREEVDALGRSLFEGRFCRVSLPPERMPDFYRSGDVLLHMSREESFGNIYIEAAACGLPVVAHDYETTRWIFPEGSFLGDTAREGVTAELLRAALYSGRGAAAENREQIVQRFSWRRVVADYAGFIQETAGRGGK